MPTKEEAEAWDETEVEAWLNTIDKLKPEAIATLLEQEVEGADLLALTQAELADKPYSLKGGAIKKILTARDEQLLGVAPSNVGSGFSLVEPPPHGEREAIAEMPVPSPALEAKFERAQEPLSFDTFFSHKQSSGQAAVALLSEKMKARGAKTWYDLDVKGDLNAEAMEAGVRDSRSFCIFLSKDYFSSKACCTECRWAKLYGCRIIGIKLDEAEDAVNAVEFGREMQRCPADLKHLFDDVEFVPFRRRGNEMQTLLSGLCEKAGVEDRSEPPLPTGAQW